MTRVHCFRNSIHANKHRGLTTKYIVGIETRKSQYNIVINQDFLTNYTRASLQKPIGSSVPHALIHC